MASVSRAKFRSESAFARSSHHHAPSLGPARPCLSLATLAAAAAAAAA
eukprot:CAMPEP_0171864448 /NCGR_PEP_ID=MMETSP0992-20121227/28865_1 /TAXON_ID=483369 /ORGANISM="non described non described, Strain CCMP2098" /LENGTH=47 /DNA_ID= /DNA_START= /DNA_END= /DNA_ORIENTATION=